jgi:antitoxin component of RelBE/YafQ-DinJ toxin-antitoxin module
MGETTTVAFRIDESVKEEWEEAADGPEYDSLSHLIRLAVQKEISGEGARTDAQGGGEAEADAEVLQTLNRLERAVSDVQDEVETMGRESEAGELYDLEQVLLEVLPSGDVDLTADDPANLLDTEPVAPQEVAARIGADEQDVSDALNRLADNTGQVRRSDTALEDEPSYWKVE